MHIKSLEKGSTRLRGRIQTSRDSDTFIDEMRAKGGGANPHIKHHKDTLHCPSNYGKVQLHYTNLSAVLKPLQYEFCDVAITQQLWQHLKPYGTSFEMLPSRKSYGNSQKSHLKSLVRKISI